MSATPAAVTAFSKNRGRPSSVAPATPLATLRARRGLTLKELEAATGINVAIWSQLERGLMVPQPRHLAALAHAFDVPLSSWRVRFVLETEAIS
jgi:transcriptional regulator with XRE-family HTH domain